MQMIAVKTLFTNGKQKYLALSSKIFAPLLYLTALLLPFNTKYIWALYSYRPFGEYDTPAFFLTDLLILNLLFFSGGNLEKIFTKIKLQSYWLIWAFLSLASFGIYLTTNKIIFLVSLAHLLLFIAFAWLIINGKYNLKKLFFSLIIGAALSASLGLFQFFNQTAPANKWLGLAQHNPETLGTSVVLANNVRYLRAYGTLDHPNILGGFLVIILIIIFFLLSNNKKDTSLRAQMYQSSEAISSNSQNNSVTLNKKNFHEIASSFLLAMTKEKKYQFKKIFLYSSIILISASLFFSFSRSAFLALFVALIIFFLSSRNTNLNSTSLSSRSTSIRQAQDRHPGSTSLLKPLTALLSTFLILFTIYNPLWFARVPNQNRLENKSVNERILYQNQALDLISKRPLLGWGLGGYTSALKAIAQKSQPGFIYQPVHNIWLLITAETGLLGLLPLLSLFIFLIIKSILLAKNNSLSYLNLSLLSAVAIISLSDHWLFSLHFGLLLFWLIIGLVIRNLAESGQNT